MPTVIILTMFSITTFCMVTAYAPGQYVGNIRDPSYRQLLLIAMTPAAILLWAWKAAWDALDKACEYDEYGGEPWFKDHMNLLWIDIRDFPRAFLNAWNGV